MPDPLALVPFAIAAGGGRLDGIPASQLVAAGVTLLQRAAPLVRALAGRRAGVLLPPTTPTHAQPGGAWLVALAASDGRGMVLLSPPPGDRRLDSLCETHHIGALFTTRHTLAAWQADVPSTMPVVLLDDAPHSAHLQSADGTLDRVIDLGTHFGIPVEGDPAVEGANEECLVLIEDNTTHIVTHRALLHAARTRQPTLVADAMVVSAPRTSARLRAIIAELSALLDGGHVTEATAVPM